MRSMARLASLSLCLLIMSCGGSKESVTANNTKLLEQSWNQIEAQARGQTVTWGMWVGDPLINRYITEYVVPELKKRFGVTLDVVSAQGNTLVASLMTEREAKQDASAYDLTWINGETFYQLRQIDALLGPFTAKLPNAQYIDFESPFIKYDFQQDTRGYECPWGNVQLAIIYNSTRVGEPPRTMAALEAWVKEHPGRFTFDTSFTGLTFLKSLLIESAGGPDSLNGPFDAARYERASGALWGYLERIKPFLWKQGQTFPTEVANLHQLFAAQEVDFTMSNNDAEVDNKVLQGLFSDDTRGYVLDSGTIQNSHYLGIPRNAPHLAGALVVANFLISAEAQFEKVKPAVWGDGTVLDVARLPAPWPERFANVPQRTHIAPRAELQPKALREPDAEYMIRLQRDFRRVVIEGQKP